MMDELFGFRHCKLERLLPKEVRQLETGSPYWKMLVIQEGSGWLSVKSPSNGDHYQLKLQAFNAYVIQPLESAEIAANMEQDKELQWIAIDFVGLNVMTHLSSLDRSQHEELWLTARQRCFNARPMWDLIYQLMTCIGSSPIDKLQRHVIVQQLVLCWWEQWKEQGKDEETAEQRIESVLAYIHKYFRKPVSKQELADLAGLSVSHFSDLFKKRSGRSPMNYIASLRLNHAKSLLLSSTKGLRHVADQAGFSDECYFNRVFKQQTGITPGVYRKRDHQSVVSFAYPLMSHLHVLGISPQAALIHPADQTLHANGTVLLSYAESRSHQLEQIHYLQPDMVFFLDHPSAAEQEFREAIQALSPVVVIPWMSLDWKQQLLLMAHVLKRMPQAECWLSDFNKQVEQQARWWRNKMGQEETLGILQIGPGWCSAYGARNIGHVFYRELQVSASPSMQRHLQEQSTFYAEDISLEQLDGFVGDRMLVMIREDLQGSKDYFKAIRYSEQWRMLENRCKGKITYLDARPWLGYDPLSIRCQLESINRLFSG